MTKTIEKNVLMKCSRCKYEELVPLWVLEELDEFTPNQIGKRSMCCPKCDANMYEVVYDNEAEN